jgi:hypothetical protein
VTGDASRDVGLVLGDREVPQLDVELDGDRPSGYRLWNDARMEPVAAAYLAALIDGEGVITIARNRSSGKTVPVTYQQRIIVTNSHRGLVQFCREVTGLGTVYHAKSVREGWAPISRWQVTNSAARTVLADVLPYLVVKRQQAAVTLQMPIAVRGGRGPGAADIYAAQERAHETVKALNARGGGHPDAWHDFPRDHPALRRPDRVVVGQPEAVSAVELQSDDDGLRDAAV